MKLAILTCGMLPIPAVQGGAVENLIDFYLEYNDIQKLHDITVYSPWDARIKDHPALKSRVNHYVLIDTSSLKAKVARRLHSFFHSNEYYNYFIEYYFEQAYADLKKKDYDYIIIENGAGLAYKLTQRGHRNLLLHLHNDLLNTTSRYHDAIAGGFKKILTVSDYVRQRVATVCPTDKIQTVYNGIDLQRFSPKEDTAVSRQQLGFAEDDFVVAFSGRINHEKGISELIDAMLQLQDHPSIKLLVLGSTFFDNASINDAFACQLRDKSERIRHNIRFTGFIPYAQVPGYLRLADIAALPSMWEEPFGLTIVEAMAVGLPLITTRSGGIPEICEGVATIVERENVANDLATAILDLYQHPEKRRQMAAAALQRARRFDKDTFAKQFFAAIESVK